MNNSRFRRGSGAFKCDVCGRGTRATGAQPLGSRLCPECNELAGIENAVLDGEPLAYYAVERDRLIVSAISRGGSEVRLRKEFESLFAD